MRFSECQQTRLIGRAWASSPFATAKIDNVHQTNGRLKYSLIQPTII